MSIFRNLNAKCDGTTDGQTDRRTDSSINICPPTGGIQSMNDAAEMAIPDRISHAQLNVRKMGAEETENTDSGYARYIWTPNDFDQQCPDNDDVDVDDDPTSGASVTNVDDGINNSVCDAASDVYTGNKIHHSDDNTV
ncbi:hypothetical protein DPMN_137861 [Dreissena polymorpha]|uniref:Uncharacterized protein n=1 Tax=Dreissena polymorpha TaxID=45954 RepID=A0A9D4G6J5_DREPO|nr:hypothetical protein DPMN_137861 [Dreissena polymorpha]